MFAAPSAVAVVRVAPLPKLVDPACGCRCLGPGLVAAGLWSLDDPLELQGMVLHALTVILAVSSILLTLAWFPSIPI